MNTQNAHPNSRGEGHKEETRCCHDSTDQDSEAERQKLRWKFDVTIGTLFSFYNI